jgi:DNA-binding cell septation regulator SpoVG
MQISEVQITPIKANNGLVAIASVVFENSLFLGSIGVYTKRNGPGYRITYPTKNKSGRDFNIYHPINREIASAIEIAVIDKAEAVLESSNYQERSNENNYDRHSHTNHTQGVV